MNRMIHIIDDDMDVLAILKIFFSRRGFTVVTDYNGEELDVNSGICPGVYLIDINLIGKNGTDLCKLIKKECSHVPVILMSANNDLEKLAKDCHADAYFSKPFDVQQMLTTVNQLVA